MAERTTFFIEEYLVCMKDIGENNVRELLGEQLINLLKFYEEIFLAGVVGIPKGFITIEEAKTIVIPEKRKLEGWEHYISDVDTAEKFDEFFEVSFFKRSCELYRELEFIKVISYEDGENNCIFMRKRPYTTWSRFLSESQLKTVELLKGFFASYEITPTQDMDKTNVCDFYYYTSMTQVNLGTFRKIVKQIKGMSPYLEVVPLKWNYYIQEDYRLSSDVRLIRFDNVEKIDRSSVRDNYERTGRHIKVLLEELSKMDNITKEIKHDINALIVSDREISEDTRVYALQNMGDSRDYEEARLLLGRMDIL